MKNYSLWLFTACISLGSISCATLFSGDPQELSVSSNVVGAEVILNGVPVGKTPFKIWVERETFKQMRFLVRAEGYLSREVRVRKTLNKVAIFNLSSMCSWGTDALTGAMIEYSPQSYFIELLPNSTPTIVVPVPGISQDRHPRADSRRFMVVNWPHLLRDIARGEGEFLNSLDQVLEVEPNRRPGFHKKLQANLDNMLAMEHPDQAFALVESAAYALPN